jgi:hypothetical protein
LDRPKRNVQGGNLGKKKIDELKTEKSRMISELKKAYLAALNAIPAEVLNMTLPQLAEDGAAVAGAAAAHVSSNAADPQRSLEADESARGGIEPRPASKGMLQTERAEAAKMLNEKENLRGEFAVPEAAAVKRAVGRPRKDTISAESRGEERATSETRAKKEKRATAVTASVPSAAVAVVSLSTVPSSVASTAPSSSLFHPDLPQTPLQKRSSKRLNSFAVPNSRADSIVINIGGRNVELNAQETRPMAGLNKAAREEALTKIRNLKMQLANVEKQLAM